MAATPFGNFQSEIYLRGTTGERPRFTTDLARLEDAAREAMTPEAFGYVAGSAGSGATARANRRAFDRWRIVPRMLRDVAERDVSTSVLGTDMPAPVLLAPIGVQTIVHPDGELARRGGRGPGPHVHPLHRRGLFDRAGGRGVGRRAALVPALLAGRARGGGLAGGPGRGGRLRGAHGHPGHLHDGLAAHRPRRCLPAVPGRDGHRQLPHRPGVQRAAVGGRPAGREGVPLGRRVRQPARRGTTWPGCGSGRACPSCSRACSTPTTPGPRWTPGSTAFVVSNHGGARWTGPSPRSTRCRPWSRRWARRCPCWSTPGCGPAPTSSRPWPSGRPPCSTGGPTSTGWLGGQAGVEHVLRCLLGELDVTLALSGHRSLAELGPDVLAPAPE